MSESSENITGVLNPHLDELRIEFGDKIKDGTLHVSPNSDGTATLIEEIVVDGKKTAAEKIIDKTEDVGFLWGLQMEANSSKEGK